MTASVFLHTMKISLSWLCVSTEHIDPTVTEVTVNSTGIHFLTALKSTQFRYWQPRPFLNNENAPEATKTKELTISGKEGNTK